MTTADATFRDRLADLTEEKRGAVLDTLYEQRIASLRDSPRPEELPISLAQQRLWFIASTDPDNANYNIPGLFRITGELATPDLEAALTALIERHEMLRCRITGSAMPRMELTQDWALPLDVVDASGATFTDAQARSQARDFLRLPFALTRAPLWRALLIRCAEDTSYLVVSFHHVVFDGWSLKVFIRELLALLAGQELPPLDWQYPDYALWQRRCVQLRERLDDLRSQPHPGVQHRGQRGKADRFWQNYLNDLPDPADIVTGPVPAERSNDGALLITELPAQAWHDLLTLARAEGATPFAASLAALTVLTHRRSGQSDLIVGTPVSGRAEPRTQGIIGDFVNTIPVRTRLDDQMTSRDVLRAVSQSSVEAFAHDDVPFDRIVEIANPVRSQRVHPLFQVLFTFQPAIAIEDEGGLHVDYLDLDFGTAKFDLSLDVVEDQNTVRLLFEYSTDRFDRGAIADLADSYRCVVEQMVRRPDVVLADLSMLSAEQRESVLSTSRGPSIEVAPETLPEIIGRHAVQFPKRPAVTADRHTMSYSELDSRSERIRSRVEAVASEHQVVGLLLPRCTELFAAMLGVWKSGRACLVLDPVLPTERIEAMLLDAGAVLLTERVHLRQRPMLERGATSVAILSEEPEETRNAASASDQSSTRSELAVPEALALDDTAYVVFTSGSTGQPKGIAISHRAYVGMLAAWRSMFDLDSPETLQIAASSFDVFYGDVARTLGAGGHLHVLEPEIVADPARFADFVRGRRFDLAEFVPSVFRRIADYLRAGGERLDVLHVVVASEMWTTREARLWLDEVLTVGTRLYNTYGVAEATVDSTWFECSADLPGHGTVPIGAALPNTEVYVLDPAGKLAASATRGRLLIGGVGLGQGYVGRHEKENARFAEYDLGEGLRTLYDTGDLAYRTSGGDLVLAGRSDDQVKVRGVRIELGEIEHVLRGLPSVTDVAVTVSGEAGAEQLVAWVRPTGAEPQIQRWNAALTRSLPSSMLPQIVVTAALPYLNSGKVDRQSLARAPRPTATSRMIAPRTADETEIHRIFAEVLQVETLGVTDSFFALGGHSLTALELISRMRSTFGVGLRIADLFDHPTVEALALRLAGLVEADDLGRYAQVEPDLVHRYEPFPLTDVQQAYWLGRDSIFEFSGVATHSYDDFHGTGLDIDRFTRALNGLIQRHEMMRAIVIPDDAQLILSDVDWYDPPVYDLTHADAQEVAEHLEEVRTELSHQQIDMTTWPTFDIRVSLLPADKQVLHFSTDALMLDAWGFVTVMRDLNMIYDDVEMEALTFSFRDYVVAEKALEETEKYERTKAYWDQRIPTLPATPALPMAQRPDDLAQPIYTRHHVELDATVWARIKQHAAARDLTATTVCLTAYAQVLASRVHDPHFSLNLTFLNRKPFHPQVHEVVGEFTSLTLLEVEHSEPKNFAQRARTIQRDLWETLEENDMSGVKVLRNYARYHHAPTAAHFPVVFTSALAVPIPQTSENFQITHQPKHGVTQTSQVWLDAGIWEDEGNLRCNWDVVLDVYPEGLIPQMFGEYVELLTALAVDGPAWDEVHRPPAPEPLTLAPPYEHSLVDLVTASVSAHSQRPAVITPTTSLTYAELAASAADVCRMLGDHDVRRGELVGVFMDVGWEQAAAVLGCVSVAAYLPMSPDLPAARLRQITEAAGVRVILTQEWLADDLTSMFDGTILCVDRGDHGVQDAVAILRESPPSPQDLAYVIYTSGSTGLPKGVMIDHCGVVNTVLDVNERFGVTDSDRVLALSSLSFDLSVYDIFGMLIAGAAVVMPDDAHRLDPLHQRDLVREHRVSVWNTVPALFDLFLGASPEECPSLRIVMLSGDWIPLPVVPLGQRLCPNASLHSLGGATEASIWSITYPITRLDPTWASVPYGKGMKNQDVVALDRDMGLAPCWVIGDLYIRGTGLAMGYYGDQDRTDEAFLHHPITGERLYRTGDLGRLLPSGDIEFLGRSDFQLKIGGYRVEAGDVERAVRGHHQVRDALVLALGEGQSDKRLACLWVPTDPHAAGQVDLPTYLHDVLPPYMVPLIYVPTVSLPLSGNGKVDRTAARRMFSHVDVSSAPYVGPTTPQDRAMVDVWTQVLRRDDIGMHDDFFQIGGDSIGAIDLMTRLRKHFDQPVSLAQIYERRTPTAMLSGLADVDRGSR